jgi:hypothetical protein
MAVTHCTWPQTAGGRGGGGRWSRKTSCARLRERCCGCVVWLFEIFVVTLSTHYLSVGILPKFNVSSLSLGVEPGVVVYSYGTLHPGETLSYWESVYNWALLEVGMWMYNWSTIGLLWMRQWWDRGFIPQRKTLIGSNMFTTSSPLPNCNKAAWRRAAAWHLAGAPATKTREKTAWNRAKGERNLRSRGHGPSFI